MRYLSLTVLALLFLIVAFCLLFVVCSAVTTAIGIDDCICCACEDDDDDC